MLPEKAKSPAFWQSVRKDPAYQSIISHIKTRFEENVQEEYPALRYRDRRRFYGDGDRSRFEKPYFHRRIVLSAGAILALLYPEEEKYLVAIEDVMWAILDEYSWALPAHTDGTLKGDLSIVDLFNAETGMALAEITFVLGERLDEVIRDRVHKEIRRRVIETYREGHFGWETTDNNWAAVCAGAVGCTLMYADPAEFKRQEPRLLATMKCFLSGFPEDGTCLEGFSYWLYGFGYFVWFSDLYKRFTGKDLLDDPKVERIAGYIPRSILRGVTTVSYSDGTSTGIADLGLQHYLHARFPKSVPLPPEENLSVWGGNIGWLIYLRAFLYFDPAEKSSPLTEKDIFLPDAGQYLARRGKYAVAIKAGHNDEPHNHNDIGSFILATDEGQVFVDLGSGLYTRQYFEPATRYTILCNSSFGHSVPYIAGQGQKEGRAYKGTIARNADGVTVEMADAYEKGVISALSRRIIAGEEEMILVDTFDCGEKTFTERFVTLVKPDIYEDHVRVQGVTLTFDAEKAKLTLREEKHLIHTPTFGEDGVPVWCLDFEVLPGENTFRAVFTF
ncbi:MAG: heparinase II/III-family protein [Clostridia bacterium]|nr:heparinase II/III-family protein [Clostridia bacterium]